jgi:hypothetical protein
MSKSRRLRAERKRTDALQPDAEKKLENRLSLSPGAQKLLALFFLAATIVGLYLGLRLAFSYQQTSDSANAGLFPMEVMRGNFEYVFPVNNPYFFTDYIFHMIVQPLSGYSPVALVLTCYAIYVLIVVACALLALRLAGRMEALAAAALVANLSFNGLRYVLYALYHNGTILFILLSILVFYADRPPFRLSARSKVLILTLLQFLGVFSDTIMIPLFTLPLIVYSVYQLIKQRQAKEPEMNSNEGKGTPILWLASTVPALAIYALKPHLGQLWPGGPILAPAADLGAVGNLLQHPGMLNDYISALISVSGGLIAALVVLAVVLLVILTRKDRFLQTLLVAGGIFMMIGFMSMRMEGNPARYLNLIIILALVVIATGIMRKGLAYIPLIAAVAIVLVFIGSNVQLVNEPHPDYSTMYQQFIDYLEGNHITHAYADYWSANIYTYLSGGKVMIEPCYVIDGRLKFYHMNSAPRWASIWPDGNDTEPVIITVPGDSLYDYTQELNKNHPPVKAYPVGNGWIYVYNGTLPAWPAG